MADDDILRHYYGEPSQPGADEVVPTTMDVLRRMRPPPGPLSRALQGTASALDAFAEGPEGIPNKAHLVPFLARAAASGARSIDNWTQGRPQVQDMLAPTGGALLGTAPIGSLAAGAARREPAALRAYHGTDRELKGGKFIEGGPGGEGNFAHLDLDVPPDGVWFTDTPNRAAYFAKAAERNRGGLGDPGTGQNIIPADLNFKNPYTHPAAEMADEGISSLPPLDDLRRRGHDGVIVPRAKWSTDWKGYAAPTHEEQVLEHRLAQATSEHDQLANDHGLKPGWYFADTTRVDWDPVARRVSDLSGEMHDLYKQITEMQHARARPEPGPLRLNVDGYDYAALNPGTVKSATTGETLFADQAKAQAPGAIVGGLDTNPLREAYGHTRATAYRDLGVADVPVLIRERPR